MTNYNFDFALSATISDKTVEEIVKRAVEELTGKTVSKITFLTREESDYKDRYRTTVFNGCTVEFQKSQDK